MKKISLFLIVLLMISGVCAAKGQTEFYVDCERGNDSFDGTSEKPMQTIAAAVAAVKKVNMHENIYVYISDGTYFLDEPVIFDEGFYGRKNSNIVFEGGKNTVISGGKRIEGWSLYDEEKNIYKASANGIITRQLFVNGERAVRARCTEKFENVKNTDFGFTTTSTFLENVKNIDDVEFIYREYWANPRISAKGIRRNGKTLEVVMNEYCWNKAINNGQATVTVPWYCDNAYEFIDEGGEFYLDTKEDMFY